MQLLYAALFAVFLGLGVAVRRAAPGEARRRRIVRLILYVTVVNLAAGLAQRDAWPFTSHTIAVGRARPDAQVCLIEFAGVDAAGREWTLDPYSWTPVFESVLQYWWERTWPRLSETERARVLSFLLDTAEERRARLASGRSIGPERWLGPLGAPYWLLLPRPAVAPQPLRGLRVYSACWRPRERYGDPERRTRRLVAEQ